MAMMREALGLRGVVPPLGRGSERTVLLAPAVLVAALAFAGLGAGGIHHLGSLGEVATGPAPAGGAAAPSSGAEDAADLLAALTRDSLARERGARASADQAPAAGGDLAAAGRGGGAATAATGVAEVASREGPAASSGAAGGGDQPRSSRDPVGDLSEAVSEPVRDSKRSVDRVVDKLLDQLEGAPEAAPLPRSETLRAGP